jgi:hypothetical protein
MEQCRYVGHEAMHHSLLGSRDRHLCHYKTAHNRELEVIRRCCGKISLTGRCRILQIKFLIIETERNIGGECFAVSRVIHSSVFIIAPDDAK